MAVEGGSAVRDIVVPMSELQQRWWLAQRVFADPGLVLLSMVRVSGIIDVGVLQAAVTDVVRRHEALRTTFARVNGKPVQTIHPESPAGVFAHRVLDEDDDIEEALASIIADEHRNTFDLRTGPLFTLSAIDCGDLEWALLLKAHHIIADGYAVGLLWQELSEAYGYRSRDMADPHAGCPAPQLRDWVVRENEYRDGPRAAAEIDYWRAVLRDLKPSPLPYDLPAAASASYRSGALPFGVPHDVVSALHRTGQERSVSSYMITLAAFLSVLVDVTGSADAAVMTWLNHRGTPETQRLVGSIANECVIAVHLPPGTPRAEALSRVRERLLDAYENNHLSAHRIWREVGFAPGSVDAALIFDQAVPSVDRFRFGGLSADLVRTGEQDGSERRGPSAQSLRLRLGMSGTALTGVVEYDANRFTRSRVDAVAAAFLQRLRDFVDADAPGARTVREPDPSTRRTA